VGDHGQAQQPRRLADFIRERREQIISDWEARIRRLKPAERLERPVLLDHTPTFLDEYSTLRECLLELASRELSPARLSAEMPRLHAAIDLAISESVTRFSGAHDRTLRALDRISAAALEEPEVLVREAFMRFDEDGELADEEARAEIAALLEALVEATEGVTLAA